MTAATDLLLVSIEAIYDAAAAPQLWPIALHNIALCFGSEGATLQDRRDDGTLAMVGSPSMDAVIADYQSAWWDKDIRVERAMNRGFLVAKGVVTDHDLVSPEEIESHPIYTQYLARHGLGWVMGVAVAPHPRVIAAVSVQRAKHKGPFTDAETSMLARIGQHVEKSMRLSIRLQDAEVSNLALGEALARLGSAVFLLDSNGHVIFANSAAQAMNGSGFTLAGRHLLAQDLGARAFLDAAVASQTRAGAYGVDGGPDDIQPILLPAPNGQSPKVAYVLPAGSHLRDVFASPLTNVAAMVLIVDTDRGAPTDPALLRDLLGVTLGEARLAALIGKGIAPRQAAEMLGITEQTARVVLKRVFSKTGISRQSELSALISRLTLVS